MRKLLFYVIIYIINILNCPFWVLEKNLLNFKETINVEKARTISPIVLAFVGDAVYSLYVREKLVLQTSYKTGALNEITSLKVCAKAQALHADLLQEVFTQEETDIFKRGRNAKKPAKSKSCSVVEYNKSTGLEAVIGFLYLTGNYDRITELMEIAK